MKYNFTKLTDTKLAKNLASLEKWQKAMSSSWFKILIILFIVVITFLVLTEGTLEYTYIAPIVILALLKYVIYPPQIKAYKEEINRRSMSSMNTMQQSTKQEFVSNQE